MSVGTLQFMPSSSHMAQFYCARDGRQVAAGEEVTGGGARKRAWDATVPGLCLRRIKWIERGLLSLGEGPVEAESAGMIASGMARVMGLFMSGSAEPLPKPDIPLNDGDTIEVGDLSFTVLHTPGHSPGGISLYGHGVVFVGDTLFNLSIGRTDFPGCSHQQLIDSINSKLMTLPDNTVVYPGHGPHTTIATERRYNPFLVG